VKNYFSIIEYPVFKGEKGDKMPKIAFIFPGQGSQYIGMGKDLYDNSPEARQIFDEADKVLGRSISGLCFNGPEEQLKDTRNSQPCIFTASVAVLKALAAEGIRPDFVAGHSLGEYSALVAAGAISFQEALRLLNRRAQLMGEADPTQQGTMAAVMGLERDVLDECLKAVNQEQAGPVEAANFNSPGQIVVSGAKAGIAKLQDLVAGKGGRFIPLPVSGAFHSSFMKKAADTFHNDLQQVTWQEPATPIVANVSAHPVKASELADSLYRQLYSPVLWEDTLKFLAGEAVQIFVEVGPGKVLAGLVKRTLKDVTILNCEDSTSMKKALAILKEV
jgi:[acyl-carrier-protein] S-malonyltransferase